MLTVIILTATITLIIVAPVVALSICNTTKKFKKDKDGSGEDEE